MTTIKTWGKYTTSYPYTGTYKNKKPIMLNMLSLEYHTMMMMTKKSQVKTKTNFLLTHTASDLT